MRRPRGYVLVADRLFDGRGGVLVNPVVVVEGGVVADVGTRGSVEFPEGYEVIELRGVTLLPGLIDAHVHFSGLRTYSPAEALTTPPELRALRAARDAERALMAGFTTVRDCGSTIALHLKRAVGEGTVLGPTIVAAGRLLQI